MTNTDPVTKANIIGSQDPGGVIAVDAEYHASTGKSDKCVMFNNKILSCYKKVGYLMNIV